MVTLGRSDLDHQQRLLATERDRAERLLNAVRLVVLVLLVGAALAYAPQLPRALNIVNASLLAIMLSWTLGQHRLFFQRERLPPWLSVTNSIVEITALTALVAAYGVAYSPDLALKAPIVAAYFIILAALPVASTTRMAAWVSALVVLEYATLLMAFLASGRLVTVLSPVAASSSGAVSPLDEGAKILLLAGAGAVATYATHWQERLSRRVSEAARESEQLQARLGAGSAADLGGEARGQPTIAPIHFHRPGVHFGRLEERPQGGLGDGRPPVHHHQAHIAPPGQDQRLVWVGR